MMLHEMNQTVYQYHNLDIWMHLMMIDMNQPNNQCMMMIHYWLQWYQANKGHMQSLLVKFGIHPLDKANMQFDHFEVEVDQLSMVDRFVVLFDL